MTTAQGDGTHRLGDDGLRTSTDTDIAAHHGDGGGIVHTVIDLVEAGVDHRQRGVIKRDG